MGEALSYGYLIDFNEPQNNDQRALTVYKVVDRIIEETTSGMVPTYVISQITHQDDVQSRNALGWTPIDGSETFVVRVAKGLERSAARASSKNFGLLCRGARVRSPTLRPYR